MIPGSLFVITVTTTFLFGGRPCGLQYGEKKGRIAQVSTEDTLRDARLLAESAEAWSFRSPYVDRTT